MIKKDFDKEYAQYEDKILKQNDLRNIYLEKKKKYHVKVVKEKVSDKKKKKIL